MLYPQIQLCNNIIKLFFPNQSQKPTTSKPIQISNFDLHKRQCNMIIKRSVLLQLFLVWWLLMILLVIVNIYLSHTSVGRVKLDNIHKLLSIELSHRMLFENLSCCYWYCSLAPQGRCRGNLGNFKQFWKKVLVAEMRKYQS